MYKKFPKKKFVVYMENITQFKSFWIQVEIKKKYF